MLKNVPNVPLGYKCDANNMNHLTPFNPLTPLNHHHHQQQQLPPSPSHHSSHSRIFIHQVTVQSVQGHTEHLIPEPLPEVLLRRRAVEVLRVDEGSEGAVLFDGHVAGRHAIQATVRVEEVLKTTGTWLENKSTSCCLGSYYTQYVHPLLIVAVLVLPKFVG